MKQKGQMILMLILIMTVALAIGLSIVQKSLVDVSTSSKVEQSSRAFSAAEAGIEKALQPNASKIEDFPLANSSTIKKVEDSNLPPPPKEGVIQAALEYPPLAKEDVAQVWLANSSEALPDCSAGAVCYNQSTLDVYWGNSQTDEAALEVTLIHHDVASGYKSRKWYLDSKTRSNGFELVSDCRSSGYTPEGSSTAYHCKKRLGDGNGSVNDNSPLPSRLMLIRARLLYNTSSQPFAVQATTSCPSGCLLPSQARTITSTGVSGETQRKVKVFQLYKVVPHYFDYAIFSAGEISK